MKATPEEMQQRIIDLETCVQQVRYALNGIQFKPDLATRAASIDVRVEESDISWCVIDRGNLDMTFAKRLFHKSVAETYAVGLALQIAASLGGK